MATTLPNFLIIGTPKAGTTSLYYYLKQHPQIYLSSRKEPRFFSYETGKTFFNGPGDEQVERIVVKNWKDYLELFNGVKGEKAIGEASVDYLSSPIAPEKISKYLPKVKLIAILRNPVDRAYSNFLHVVRQGREPILNFEMALREENNRINAGWMYFWHYAKTGFYYQHLKRFYKLFPKDQIAVFLYEDFKLNNERVLKEIFTFLEVDSTFFPDTSSTHNNTHPPSSSFLARCFYYPNPIRKLLKGCLPQYLRSGLKLRLEKSFGNKCPKVPLAAAEILSSQFREDIFQLQDLINMDLNKWLVGTN